MGGVEWVELFIALTRGWANQHTSLASQTRPTRAWIAFSITYIQTKHQLTMTAPPYFPVRDTERGFTKFTQLHVTSQFVMAWVSALRARIEDRSRHDFVEVNSLL